MGTLSVMDWPRESLYLNIIEVVKDHLNKEWNKRQPTPKKPLKNAPHEAQRSTSVPF